MLCCMLNSIRKDCCAIRLSHTVHWNQWPYDPWRWVMKVIDSLAPGRSGFNFKSVIFNLVLLIHIFRSSYDNALRWMSWNLSEDKSTLVQVMAQCRQATSNYLSQCWWPRSVSPYGVTRSQWVKLTEFNTASENPEFYVAASLPRVMIAAWWHPNFNWISCFEYSYSYICYKMG